MSEMRQEQYENFVKSHPAGTFFQSWAFGEFQEKIPYRGKSWALIYPRNDIAASCLIIKMKLRLGKCWLWIPYGPLIVENNKIAPFGRSNEVASLRLGLFEDLARIAKEENAIFARIEPISVIAHPLRGYPAKQSSPQRFTPEHSLVLDLEKSEDEILAQMKPKGRYNISTALRHGVYVEQFVPGHTKVQSSLLDVKNRINSDFDAFYKILQKTGSRDGFGIHPKFFYETLLETFGANGVNLFLAYNDKREVIGGIIVIFYKDTATYYYGASSYEHRNLMAPYLLQWEAIREAKRRGMKKYDFLGIAPPNVIASEAKQSHPWAGITEFKKKFGGREITYPPAFDVVYRPLLYRAMRLVQSYRQ